MSKWNPGWWGILSWGLVMFVTLMWSHQIFLATTAAVFFGLSLGRVTWSNERTTEEIR